MEVARQFTAKEIVKMKIDELKNGDVVVQCIDTGTKSAYTPPVRRMVFTVVVDSYGVVLDDGKGCQRSPDFSEGRWYLRKRRDWTADEMRGLVGKTVTDDFGTRLIVEYNNGNGTIADSSGFKRLGPGEVGSVFGEKYDLIKID